MRYYFLILVCLVSSLGAQLRKEFSALENLQQRGKLDDLKEQLAKLTPSSNDEKALVSYLNAMLKKDKNDALQMHLSNADRNPKTDYGQKSMLEAAKLYILERDIAAANAQLRKITSTLILERYYWLGVCAFWQDDYNNAISHAENYLRLAPQGVQAESAYHIISDSYIAQKKYYSAITTLNKIKAIQDHDQQYLNYRIGYANELSGKPQDALQAYKTAYELNKYSQIAFSVEERLFAMRSRTPSLDLSFLYPYTPLEILTPAVPADSLAPVVVLPPTITLPEPGTNVPLKLGSKPSKGIYLQAGRFSVEANASKLCNTIRDAKLPAVYYEDKTKSSTTWVVLAGPFVTRSDADAARTFLQSTDISSFIVQY